MKSNRRHSRELCLQVLYSYIMTSDPINQIITNIKNIDLEAATEYDEDLLEMLVIKTIKNMEMIDDKIKQRAKNWNFDRIALIDKLILRQSIAELLFCDDVPPRVTISEAIELGKNYSTDDSHIFINGMLDRIYHDFIEEGKLLPRIDSEEKKEEKE
ncbi:MAG: transcription antitermination factor NusB [Candidatus Marinimicrobia bacterium]|nr:transcription antitermination factor NusB [Candidatus Neomarinimicrobiota bacterium]